jgi:hypothetical protein
VVQDAPERRCSLIGAGGGHRATIMVGIRGEMGNDVNGDLSSLKLLFKGVTVVV